MRIDVVAGAGAGPTQLAAFDEAEMKIGVAECNLIRLSSVIPPGSEVVELDGATTKNPQWGDKLYCIYAEKRTITPGENAWVGVGRVILEDGKGLFCEHDGGSRDEVADQIRGSLTNFLKIRNRNPDESEINMKIAGLTCNDQPVYALAMAVCQAQYWEE